MDYAGVQKAVAAAVVSVLSLVGFFVAVDPNTVETILALTGAIGNVVVVWGTRNSPAPTATRLD